MSINRRNFLKSLAGSTAVIAMPALTMTGCNVTRKDLYSPKNIEADVPFLDSDGAQILYYASLAPSSHNSQPWTVTIIDEYTWIIGLDPKRTLPVVDSDNRGALISIGAFLENLHIASSVFGRKATINIVSTSPYDEIVAQVTFEPSDKSTESLNRITQRTTVRKKLRHSELNTGDVNALIALSGGNAYYFPKGSEHAGFIETLQIESYRIQTYKKAAMEELKLWFRLNNAEAKKHRDGLTLAGMGLGGLKGMYIRTFMNPENMLNDSSLKMSLEMNESLVKEGAGWFVLTSKGNSVADIIESGRRLERMCLMAKDYGIALAPMTQALEEEAAKKQITSNHPKDLIPQMILRAGYVDNYPEPVTLRRPVAWFAYQNEK